MWTCLILVCVAAGTSTILYKCQMCDQNMLAIVCDHTGACLEDHWKVAWISPKDDKIHLQFFAHPPPCFHACFCQFLFSGGELFSPLRMHSKYGDLKEIANVINKCNLSSRGSLIKPKLWKVQIDFLNSDSKYHNHE